MHQRQKGGGEQENRRGEERAMDPVCTLLGLKTLLHCQLGRAFGEVVTAWDRD